MHPSMDFALKMSLAYSAKCKPLCQELRLPQTAFDILMFLANNPQYKTASDIVEIRKIKANLVSINVDKLVKEGYLERKAVPGDRRKTNLACTDLARPVIKRGQALQASFFEQLFEDASEESKEAFFQMVELMSKKLDEMIEEAD